MNLINLNLKKLSTSIFGVKKFLVYLYTSIAEKINVYSLWNSYNELYQFDIRS